MDLLDWFFSFSTAHNFANFNFGFSNEVTLTSAFDAKGTPGLELPSLHSTFFCPRANLPIFVASNFFFAGCHGQIGKIIRVIC
jgi:hypothetical protein